VAAIALVDIDAFDGNAGPGFGGSDGGFQGVAVIGIAVQGVDMDDELAADRAGGITTGAGGKERISPMGICRVSGGEPRESGKYDYFGPGWNPHGRLASAFFTDDQVPRVVLATYCTCSPYPATWVLPFGLSGDWTENQKARKSLDLRANLVAGAGFEPATFRL